MGGDGEMAWVCGGSWEAHRSVAGASSACISWGLNPGTINQLVWGHLCGSGSPQAPGAPGHRLAHWSPLLPNPQLSCYSGCPLTLLPWQPACSWSREADRFFSRDTPISTHAWAPGDTGTRRPGQCRQRYGGARQSPEGGRLRGAGGEQKRQMQEEEIRPRGQSVGREGALGRRREGKQQRPWAQADRLGAAGGGAKRDSGN